MDLRSDKGFTVAELLVSMSLLLIVLSMVYYSTQAIEISGRVSDRQALFSRDISTPLHTMDKVLSQNKAIENSGGTISDGYTLTTRTPVKPGTNVYHRYVYSAGTDGRLTERVYRMNTGSTTATLLRTKVWSDANANRARGAMFTYLGGSGETTAPANARSVIVQVWATTDGRYFSGRRQIFFRNR
jgi:prepilin-type N-terminal cleavage/methylation domain-containing protein